MGLSLPSVVTDSSAGGGWDQNHSANKNENYKLWKLISTFINCRTVLNYVSCSDWDLDEIFVTQTFSMWLTEMSLWPSLKKNYDNNTCLAPNFSLKLLHNAEKKPSKSDSSYPPSSS